ncbi:MAG: low molecular weight phosphotyrosine protein phosphatase [Anaerolineales bacterium]|nr:low molecular weight phosphotyrosine protein phosphatase [Anaerolineales bacterium]
MTRLCFVCQGNICRSPLAEGVFKHLAAQAGRAADFQVESAGLGRWHLGDPPDSRAQRVARAHGVALAGRAQQFRPGDFARFDLVLALGEDIYGELVDLAPTPAARAKVRYLREYDPAAGQDRDVPDPYYGDLRDFEHAYTLIERACRALWADLAAGR